MMKSILALGLVALSTCAMGQDVGSLLDQAPMVAGVLANLWPKATSFSAKVEVTVMDKGETAPSTAAGTVRLAKGHMRWEFKVSDLKSAQLSDTAKGLLTQINGNQVLLLSNFEERWNYLVLSGAGAYLQQPFPELKLTGGQREAKTEIIGGQRCSRELRIARQNGGLPINVSVWRTANLKRLPVQVQIIEAGRIYRIRFLEVQLGPNIAGSFQLPPGLARYDTIEDLLQSVLLKKMKRSIGLE